MSGLAFRARESAGIKATEKLFLALLLGWAACGPIACSHETRPTAAHDVAACIVPCPGASAVLTAQVPEKGAMCRCWAPNAFSYTFSYPATAEDFEYARRRWDTGVKAAEQCRRKGLGWEPDQTRDNVVCVKPAAEDDTERAKALQRLHEELDESLQRTRAEFERTHVPPRFDWSEVDKAIEAAAKKTDDMLWLKRTSLGRLHPEDWPRYLPRPAWTQWRHRKQPC